jgi:hypothetical protein
MLRDAIEHVDTSALVDGLDRGGDVNEVWHGMSLLEWAADIRSQLILPNHNTSAAVLAESERAVELLLARGADLDRRDVRTGQTVDEQAEAIGDDFLEAVVRRERARRSEED